MKASQTVTEITIEPPQIVTEITMEPSQTDRNYNGTITDRDRHSLERAINFVLLQNAARKFDRGWEGLKPF
jgi:hypothetical protein